MSQQFNFENLVALCRRPHDQTQRSAAQAIDRSLVARNWLFGWYIVEYEQNGADRAEYGSQTLKRLSAALNTKIGRGFSVDALERMRRFYLLYKHIIPDAPEAEKSATVSRILPKPSIEKIQQTVSVKSTEHAEISQTLSAKLAFLASVDEIPAIRPTASD